MVSLTSNVWYEKSLQATEPCGRDQSCICFISQPYIIRNTEQIILLFTDYNSSFLTSIIHSLMMATLCSQNMQLPLQSLKHSCALMGCISFIMLQPTSHTLSTHTPNYCFATLYWKSVEAVMGKNVMFVKSINMANMNFLDLLGQYPVWTSLALLTIFDKVLMISSNSPDEFWEKTFTFSPMMFN